MSKLSKKVNIIKKKLSLNHETFTALENSLKEVSLSICKPEADWMTGGFFLMIDAQHRAINARKI